MNNRIKVLQQVLDPSGIGGVSSEYQALLNSSLVEKYDFEPMVLMNPHSGLNLHDVIFYYRKICKINPDIIHIRGAGIDSLNAVVAAKLAKRGRILVTVHGMYSDLVYINKIKKWIANNIIERLIFSWADGISCVYEAAQRRAKFLPYQKKMLPYVYNRMPKWPKQNVEERKTIRSQYGVSEGGKVAVYCGRITKEKGLEYLCEAIKKIEKEKWSDSLYVFVIGDGNYLEEMKRQMANMVQSGHVVFMGKQQQVAPYLYAGDFAILPSLHENHSISLLESFYVGMPMIATDVGGNAEIVKDGVNGIIVAPYDVEALYKAIKKMTLEEWFYNKCRTVLLETTTPQFDDSRIDGQLSTVYDMLMQKTTIKKQCIRKG